MRLSLQEQQLARSISPPSLPTHRRRARRSSKSLLLSVFFLAALLSLVYQEVASAQSSDQVASVSSISKMLRSIQQSACDGEQLSIKCNDDYIIDVITAVHSILPDTHDHVRDTKVTKPLASSATANDEQLEGERSATCPPTTNSRMAPAEQPGAITTPATTTAQQPSTSGNVTTASSNWFVCDEHQAQEQALAKETVSTLVRTECHSRNSCSLDLRWPKLDGQQLAHQTSTVTADYTTTVATTTPPTTPANASQASTLKANGAKLSRLFNEPCPLNRKLVEIVYKCRPLKMNRRTACRGSILELECPAQKVLVVASPSNYGAWANDTKNHERCSQEASNNTQLVAASPQLMQHCLADSARVANVLGSNCLFQQSCKLDVTPQVFGTPSCPSGQVEYLKMIFTCVNETLIIASNNSGNRTSQSAEGAVSRGRTVTSQLVTKQHQHQQQQRGSRQHQLDAPPFTSANVSSSSLLSSSITTATNVVVPANTAPQVNALPSSVANGAGNSGESQQDQRQQQLLSPDQPRSATQLEGSPESNRVYTIVTADSQLSGNGAGANSNSNHLSLNQLARSLLARYQPQVFIVGVCSLLLLVFGLVNKACRVGRRGDSRNSTTSSKDSKDSACSTKSSTGFKSLCSSSSSSNAAGIGAKSNGNSNSGQTSKHNSCSESCFSLDDYNLQANQQSAANSPALPTNSTPFDGAPAVHQQAGELGQAGAARPKLWTIYGNEQHQQHQNLQQRMMAAPHHTMRPTRTFVSQHQQHLRGAQCFHQLAQIAQLPQVAGQQVDQPGFQGRAGSVSNASDLLLAMANQQQQVGWCATLGPQHPHPQPSPVDRMKLLMQQQPGNPLPPGPQCAFHASQQQQQQQQQMLFPPPTASLQLELPQVPGGAGNSLLAAPQQQQHLPPPQLQEQQAQVSMRQFQANQFAGGRMQQQQQQPQS